MRSGTIPNTALFKGQLDLDEDGYVITQAGIDANVGRRCFAGGDVQDQTFRQAITAAGSGCMAALEAERYIEALGDRTTAG